MSEPHRRRGSVWSDDEFVQDAPAEYDEYSADGAAPRRSPRAGGGGSGGRGPLFLPGMMVWHPDYGTGVVVATSGSGMKRKAQVRFGQTGEVKLSSSPTARWSRCRSEDCPRTMCFAAKVTRLPRVSLDGDAVRCHDWPTTVAIPSPRCIDWTEEP